MARKPYNSSQKTFTQKMRVNKFSPEWYRFTAEHVLICTEILAGSFLTHGPDSSGIRDEPGSRHSGFRLALAEIA